MYWHIRAQSYPINKSFKDPDFPSLTKSGMISIRSVTSFTEGIVLLSPGDGLNISRLVATSSSRKLGLCDAWSRWINVRKVGDLIRSPTIGIDLEKNPQHLPWKRNWCE